METVGRGKRTTRRSFVKAAAAAGGGAILGTYVKPSMRTFAIDRVSAAGSPPPGDGETIGYWKNHAGVNYWKNNPDVVTPLLPIWLGTPGGSKSIHVTTAALAVDILGMHVYGDPSNGITKLYAQLLAAKLNVANGTDPSAIASTIGTADIFLASNDWTGWDGLSNQQKQAVLGWMALFDGYNNS